MLVAKLGLMLPVDSDLKLVRAPVVLLMLNTCRSGLPPLQMTAM
jgi:hypothetical protein